MPSAVGGPKEEVRDKVSICITTIHGHFCHQSGPSRLTVLSSTSSQLSNSSLVCCLWNILSSDCSIPSHDSDIELNGKMICSLNTPMTFSPSQYARLRFTQKRLSDLETISPLHRDALGPSGVHAWTMPLVSFLPSLGLVALGVGVNFGVV
jgi:hypothetical protein